MMKVPSWELLGNQSNRIVLWVNNLYPIKVHRLDIRSFFFHIPIIHKLTPIFPQQYKVVSIERRIKEVPESMSVTDAFDEIRAAFKASQKYFHFASRPPRVELVRGHPLVEDMDSRIPSDLLKVIPGEAKPLDMDELYRHFRQFGKLEDITKQEGHILISFDRLEGAISARNCLHRASLPSSPTSLITVEYIRIERMGWLKEHFSKNPRMMFPLVGLLATLISMLLFDPIRSWFIERKLDQPYKKTTFLSELIHFGTWCPREEETVIKNHLSSPPRSITVLAAPRGTGKSTLVSTVLHGRANVIRIDFSELDSIPDVDFINYISECVGYFPNLSFLEQISGWLDVILTPLGLSKGAFSWSAHAKLVDILHCLENALCSVAQNQLDEPMPEWPVIVLDGVLENLQSMDNKKEASLLLDVLTEFAVNVSQKRGLAHVVFISNDPSAYQTIYKLILSNGGSKMKTFSIKDVSTQAALNFVESSLIPVSLQLNEAEIEYAVSKLGGRVADLENLAQKVVSGVPPRFAIGLAIRRAINQIRIDGFGFSPGMFTKGSSEPVRKWTQAQLWKVITKIASQEVVYYDDVLVNIFGGNVEALTGLLNINILRVYKNRLMAYSPLHRSAFQQMAADKTVSVPMEITVLRESINGSVASLGKIQDELLKCKSINSGIWRYLPFYKDPRERELERQSTATSKRISELNEKLAQLMAIKLE